MSAHRGGGSAAEKFFIGGAVPITQDTLASPDPDVQKVSVVLATVMGCIDGDTLDREALDALVQCAGQICAHRSGLHDSDA